MAEEQKRIIRTAGRRFEMTFKGAGGPITIKGKTASGKAINLRFPAGTTTAQISAFLSAKLKPQPRRKVMGSIGDTVGAQRERDTYAPLKKPKPRKVLGIFRRRR